MAAIPGPTLLKDRSAFHHSLIRSGLTIRRSESFALQRRVTYPGFEHLTFDITVDRMEPQQYVSWRWHPAPEAGMDYSSEPTTLVEFTLEEIQASTRLTVVESGFDRLRPARRAVAFAENDEGWTEQMKNLERHFANETYEIWVEAVGLMRGSSRASRRRPPFLRLIR
jgi:hypothetical protein